MSEIAHEQHAQTTQAVADAPVTPEVSGNHRFRNLVGLPLAATAALLLPSGDSVPPKYDMSCASIPDDAFQPRVFENTLFGPTSRALGITLDQHTISMVGTVPEKDAETGEELRVGNKPILERPLGKISVQDGVLGSKLDLPQKHLLAIHDMFGSQPETRAVACAVGITAIARNLTHPIGDGYNPKMDAQSIEEAGEEIPEGIDLYFITEDENESPNQRVLTYTMIHEGLHAIRARVQNSETNHEAISQIRQFDELYRQHATMIVEEYRNLHGTDMIKRLDKIMNVIELSGSDGATEKDIANVRVAVELLKQRIVQPNGLVDLAVSDDKGQFKNQEVSLNHLGEMLGVVYKKVTGLSKEDVPFDFDNIKGDEFYNEGNPQLEDPKTDLYKFAKARFVPEQVLSGAHEISGHPEDSNELLASYWVITGDIDDSRFDELAATVSEPYRKLCIEELKLARQLRFTIKPADIATNGEVAAR